MVLGPPVCQHCKVLASVKSGKPSKIKGKDYNSWSYYVCPICGETDITEYAGLSGDYQTYKDNEKFLRFVLNKQSTE